jgi:hypothetical protein
VEAYVYVSWEVRTSPTKNKAIFVTGRAGLYGCEMLRIPHCLDNRLTGGGKFVSLTRRLPPYSPETYLISVSGTHIC